MVKQFGFIFQTPKEMKRDTQEKEHHAERKKVRRSAHEISKQIKEKPKFWMGKRVK